MRIYQVQSTGVRKGGFFADSDDGRDTARDLAKAGQAASLFAADLPRLTKEVIDGLAEGNIEKVATMSEMERYVPHGVPDDKGRYPKVRMERFEVFDATED